MNRCKDHYKDSTNINNMNNMTATLGVFENKGHVTGVLVVTMFKEDYRDRNRDLADRLSVAAQAERELRASHEVRDTPDPPSLRARMWRGFENPQSSTWALVFYYVTGFFIVVSVLTNIVEVRCVHRYNIKYSLDTSLANQTAAKGVVMIVCRIEIRKMAEC